MIDSNINRSPSLLGLVVPSFLTAQSHPVGARRTALRRFGAAVHNDTDALRHWTADLQASKVSTQIGETVRQVCLQPNSTKYCSLIVGWSANQCSAIRGRPVRSAIELPVVQELSWNRHLPSRHRHATFPCWMARPAGTPPGSHRGVSVWVL